MHDLSVIERDFGDLSPHQQCPEFWPAVPASGIPFIRSLKQAVVRRLGRSAGGHDILAVEYGEKEPLDCTSDNLCSSIAGKVAPCDPTEIFPTSFYGSRRRQKPVLVLQGAIHGGELTGTVASLNLCQIIETGKDLRGKAWPRLRELALETRIAIIPWLNIDGALRWPLANPTQAPHELYSRCTQGVMTDGTRWSYPEVKNYFPIPPEKTAFMGTYYNDQGVNLQYDFTSLHRQPETQAWMAYYLSERPDGVLIFHCNAGSMIGPPEYYLPEGFQHEVSRLGGAVRARLLRAGYKIGRLSWAGLPGMGKPYMEQMTATYHVCGALPVMCELPCGTREYPFTLEQMLDIGLITIEETLFYAHADGLRPYEVWEKVKQKATKELSEPATKVKTTPQPLAASRDRS